MPTANITEALKEAYASNPDGVVIIHTLEFVHPNFRDENNQPTAIRVAITHDVFNAQLESSAPLNPSEYVDFLPMNFDLSLPNVEHVATPEIDISIDNVSRDIEDNLAIAAASPFITEVIYRPYLSTDLTGPQMNPPLRLQLISAEADDFRVTARAGYGNTANKNCPSDIYNTERFPGLARNT